MKSTIVSALGFVSVALAHGVVTDMAIDGKLYGLYDPYKTPYQNPVPELSGWTVPSNNPVEDICSADIACNIDSTAGALAASANAGSSVKFFWTEWPESHRGPVMTYLAACPGKCQDADPTELDFFKIDEAGLNPDGTWASDSLIADNSTWTVKIPSDLASGNYLLRHELLALHTADQPGGAEFYPMCANLKITGTGSAVPTENTVKFPGAYFEDDAGILVNIYSPKPTSYVIPGPPVYNGGAPAPEDAPTESVPTGVPAPEDAPTESASTEVPVPSDPTEIETFTAAEGVPLPPYQAGGTGTAPIIIPTAPASSATLGDDGTVTFTLNQAQTSTIVQTIKLTLTVTTTDAAQATATKTVTVTRGAKTVTVTRGTKTVTVTSKVKAPACTVAGRYRNMW